MKVAKKLVMALMLLSAVFCLGYAQSSNQPSMDRGRLVKDDMSFISEDKVWEYAWTDYPYSDFSILYHMKFDGSVEVNGHTYSKFVNYEAIKYADGLGGEGIALPEEDLYAPSYYREEGETVYMLMKDGRAAIGEIVDSPGYSEAVM
ncbi:MAG: hypothetical protein HDR88_10925, partial [Bacteroides sp.]|nr:hypothetical protein [Bacteroides sp.]